MTPRFRQILDFVTGYIAKAGYSPTYDEINAGIGLASKGNLHRMLKEMKRRGLIDFEASHARSLRILTPPSDANIVSIRCLALHEAAEIAAMSSAKAAAAIRRHAAILKGAR